MFKDLNFYITSNYGGGGQTVSRLFNYFSILDSVDANNIHILLNYRYLNYREIKPIFNEEQITNFIKQKEKLITFLKKLNLDSKDTPINTLLNFKEFKIEPNILLDSGIGTIVGYWINEKKLSIAEIKKKSLDLLSEHLSFMNIHKPDLFIALDYCKKNTYKKKETENLAYNNIIETLMSDYKSQNNLLENTLIRSEEYKYKPKIIAPIHGNKIDDYFDHFKEILKIEKKVKKQFSGFALGGLNKLKNTEICMIVKKIRDTKEKRTIHILGSAGIKKLIPLIYSGANSFDCHTPWRRANDQPSKILVPLLDKNMNILKYYESNSLSYIDIYKIKDQFLCNCPVCKKFDLNKIIEFINLRTKNVEFYYLASILIYFHGIYQYHYLLKKISLMENKEEIKFLISEIKDIKFKSSLIGDIKTLE